MREPQKSVAEPCPNELANRCYVVTGANSGIGRAAALELVRRGAHVILACRSAAAADETVEWIRSCSGSDGVEAAHLDLAELASVRACADVLLMRGRPIDGLINNAGIGGRGQTADGFELHFGVNHLGHFLLTLQLLPLLRAAPAARIVNVASAAHSDARGLDVDALRRPTASWSGWKEYAVSKLANVLFTRALSTRLASDGIHSYALHPGAVATNVWRRFPAFVGWLARPFLLTPEQGALTTLHCTLSSEAGAQTGLYYDCCAPREPSALARDDALSERLWQLSLEWSGADDVAPVATLPLTESA